MSKRVLFLSAIPHGLMATCPAPILTAFWSKRSESVSACVHH